MSDSNTSKYNGEPITFTDFQKVLETMRDFDFSRRTRKQSRIEANLKYLNDKQKELGKPVPLELLAIAFSDQPIGYKLMEEFRQNYAEWIK
jgi:hypothetical protein